MACREWFFFKHVQPCPGDAALTQQVHQGLLVDDLSASDVDEVGRRLHQFKVFAPDHVACVWTQARMKAYKVRFPENFVQRCKRNSEASGLSAIRVRRIGDDSHLKRRDKTGQFASTPA